MYKDDAVSVRLFHLRKCFTVLDKTLYFGSELTVSGKFYFGLKDQE
jgi:hypothetical protein